MQRGADIVKRLAVSDSKSMMILMLGGIDLLCDLADVISYFVDSAEDMSPRGPGVGPSSRVLKTE